MIKNILSIEQDPILSQFSETLPLDPQLFITEKDVGSLYQRIQTTFSDHGSKMIPKLQTLFTKAMEPSSIENIKQIELANCMLGINGCRHLAIVLPVLTQLNYLNLSSNNIGPNGTKELSSGISQLKSLQTLILAWNKMENKGI